MPRSRALRVEQGEQDGQRIACLLARGAYHTLRGRPNERGRTTRPATETSLVRLSTVQIGIGSSAADPQATKSSL
jgi:hypothetical protein